MFLFEWKFATWPGENGGTNDTKSFFFLMGKNDSKSPHYEKKKNEVAIFRQ
jgi:hypothetical protein